MPDGRSACIHAFMIVIRQAVTSPSLHACKPADRMERFPSCRRACMHAVRTVSQPASMTACQPARFHGERCPKHCLGEMSVQQIDFREILECIQSDESVSRSTVLSLPYTAVVVGSSPAAGTRHDGRRARQVYPINLPVWSRVRGFLFFGFTRMGRDRRCPAWRGPCFGALRNQGAGTAVQSTLELNSGKGVRCPASRRCEALSVRRAGRASSSGRRRRPTRPHGRAGSRSTECGG